MIIFLKIFKNCSIIIQKNHFNKKKLLNNQIPILNAVFLQSPSNGGCQYTAKIEATTSIISFSNKTVLIFIYILPHECSWLDELAPVMKKATQKVWTALQGRVAIVKIKGKFP